MSPNAPVKTGGLPAACLPPLLVLLAVAAVFFPMLGGEWVFDDEILLVENPHFRGLGWGRLRWMFTAFHAGNFIPLTWLSYAVDFSIWGMDPFGFHLSNLILHGANAVLVYALCLHFLERTGPAGGSLRRWASAGAALLFALHPLRVESVAAAAQRRDLVSALFLLLALLSYLKVYVDGSGKRRRWGYAGCLSFYLLSLGGKGIGVTFPAVLLLLDVYPLSRLSADWRRWGARSVWIEKIPLLALAALFGVLGVWAQSAAQTVHSLESTSIGQRLATAVFGAVFYLWKTAVPLGLSPLYEIPLRFNPLARPFLASGAAFAGITLALILLRRRWPGALLAWAVYLIILLPVSGLVHFGPQLAADRYSYLACLGWALLAGGALERLSSGREPLRRRLVLAGASCLLLGLGFLARRQVRVWRDTVSLWTQAIRVDPGSPTAHRNLGVGLETAGRYREAAESFSRALEIDPTYAEVYNNLGALTARRGAFRESLPFFSRAVALKPDYADAHYNLANSLNRLGMLDAAVRHYGEAIRIGPVYSRMHNNLGIAFLQGGDPERAAEQYRKALEIDSGDAGAAANLAALRGRIK